MAEYIEREKAFNAVLKLIPKVDDDGYCWVIRGDAATAIDSIPAADVRPVVKARFNLVDGYSIAALGYDIKGLECSNCGATFIAQSWIKKFNYCPICGADMRGEVE